MVLDYLKKRIEDSSKEQESDIPKWISAKNASLKAWRYVEELKKEKAFYIKRHYKITDFLVKKTYQIKGSDISNALGISRASLMNTSKYSSQFKEYLDDINSELEKEKEARIRKHKETPSRGSIRNSKEELVRVNVELRKKIDELESKKIGELVSHVFDQLPLPIKRKLGID
jgi:hypothetical protein